MCGIAGIYNFAEKMESSWILSMTNVLRHRGPDDEGFLAVNTRKNQAFHLTGSESKVEEERIETFDKPVDLFLGHRRLSILDTSPLGHQPMSNKDKSLWIVHNGEIYNYLELREDLKGLGYHFKTNTDTEVILAAYEEWGKDCLSKFNGMWSFVIYNRREKILFGARDRFGVKPFYYYVDEDFFAFASEIKALIKLPFVKTGINPVAVFDYLVYAFEEVEEEGFFKNIFELQPSFAFQYDLSFNSFKKWRYYTLPYTDKWDKFHEINLNKYRLEIRDLLFEAIILRLRSDVPVGSCLSGGIDSSTIVCIINNLLEKNNITQVGTRQNVFTASYESEAVDENNWANMVVEQTKTSWHRTYPKASELIGDIEDLAYTQDIPFGSTSIYAQYRVMKLARETGIKVLLDGQGGDELFTGYRGYHAAFAVEMIKHFDIFRFLQEWKGISNSPVTGKNLLVLLIKIMGAGILPPALKEISLKAVAKENNYINPDFWNEYRGRLNLIRKKAKQSLNHMLFEYMTGFNLKTLLRYEDRNSMRFSVEARTPFADDINLIEYIFQVPSVYKIHNGWSKYLLREATEGMVPESIRKRKDKIGFATPEYFWMSEVKDELKNYITYDLDDFINVRKMLNDWDMLINKQSKDGITNLWRFISLAAWKKLHAL